MKFIRNILSFLSLVHSVMKPKSIEKASEHTEWDKNAGLWSQTMIWEVYANEVMREWLDFPCKYTIDDKFLRIKPETSPWTDYNNVSLGSLSREHTNNNITHETVTSTNPKKSSSYSSWRIENGLCGKLITDMNQLMKWLLKWQRKIPKILSLTSTKSEKYI